MMLLALIFDHYNSDLVVLVVLLLLLRHLAIVVLYFEVVISTVEDYIVAVVRCFVLSMAAVIAVTM